MKYKPNHAGMKELATSAAVQEACYRGAKLVEAQAKSTHIETGGHDRGREIDEYRAGFETERREVTVTRAKATKRRMGAVVMNTSRFEAKYGGSQRILYRALEALNGVRL